MAVAPHELSNMLPTMTSVPILIGILLLLAVPGCASAVEKTNDSVSRERIETDCKLQSKKYYSVIHFKKRRMFIKHCIERAYR
jgi:hypothetical protein